MENISYLSIRKLIHLHANVVVCKFNLPLYVYITFVDVEGNMVDVRLLNILIKSCYYQLKLTSFYHFLLRCVRFNQQLVLFSPQAVSVHSHVQTLRPTLSSRQVVCLTA